MLTPYQNELIHREVDGENTPAESAEAGKLVESEPEALELLTSLQSLDALIREVPDRALSPRVRHLILEDVALKSEAASQSFTGWARQQWEGVTNLMGEFNHTQKGNIV